MHFIRLFTIVKRDVKAALRTPTQFVATPLVSASLFIFIFGSVIGSQLGSVQGVPYIAFVFPGVLALNVISTAFAGASFRMYFARFMHSIEEMLVAPITYTELIFGYMLGAFARVLIIAAGITLVGFVFGAVTITHGLFFLFWLFLTTVFFGLLGLLTGLWADSFEQLGAFPTFIITPLAFLGGMFNSITMLPGWMQTVAQFNPFFYLIDGFRYALVGVSESGIIFASIVMSIATVALFVFTVALISRGWRIRE